MSKKNRQRRALAIGNDVKAGSSAPRRPTIMFGVGDADYLYTEGKILRLAARLKAQGDWNLIIVTHDQDTLQAAKKMQLETQWVSLDTPPLTMADRLRATDEMIRETADIDIPGSTLPLWKVLAMDDFLSSLQLFGAQPKEPLVGDIVMTPIMAVDNNTRTACGLYTWMISEAQRQGLPNIGLEVSPLGNKYTLSHFRADHYAVKSEWSRQFLMREGLADGAGVSVLKWEESYQLWSGKEEYTEAYLERETEMRAMLNISADEFVVLIPHHVAFLWEVRKILAALAALEWPVTVVIRVDPRTVRRQYPERDIALQSYPKEIGRLHRVIVDERVGVGLLLQLADLVVSPFAGTSTERAALCRKPTIICQALSGAGPQGEFVCWEPQADKIPGLINRWRDQGYLARARLYNILATQLQKASKPFVAAVPPPFASAASVERGADIFTASV